MGFPDSLEFPFPSAMPTADFAEAQQWNFTDGNYGIVYHLGSMPGDLKLWHNAFAVTCPDGSVLATKIIGRGSGQQFGCSSVHSQTVEPYQTWRVAFDSGLRRYSPSELQRSVGTDGRHIPVKVELNITATHPAWDPGAGHDKDKPQGIFDTFCFMHHEQPVRASGLIEIAGERITFDGIGHRDHSFGPRNFGTLMQGFWINGTFESGWAFIAFEGTREGNEKVRRAAVFHDGEIQECEILHDANITSTAPTPGNFVLKVRMQDGTARNIEARIRNGLNWTADGPTEWCVGTDLSNPRNYIFTHYFADFICGGESGIGFADRGARADQLTLASTEIEGAPND